MVRSAQFLRVQPESMEGGARDEKGTENGEKDVLSNVDLPGMQNGRSIRVHIRAIYRRMLLNASSMVICPGARRLPVFLYI